MATIEEQKALLDIQLKKLKAKLALQEILAQEDELKKAIANNVRNRKVNARNSKVVKDFFRFDVDILTQNKKDSIKKC